MTQPVERDFANIERLLASIYAPMVGGVEHVGSHTPDNLEAVLPFLRAVRVGGPRTHLYDYPIVELDYFDVDEVSGQPAVSRLVNYLLDKPPPHPSIDFVSCDPAPRELPWGENESVRRWGATLFLETRRVRVALLP